MTEIRIPTGVRESTRPGCLAPDCDIHRRSTNALWCNRHFLNVQRHGAFTGNRIIRREPTTCTVDECGDHSTSSSTGYCAFHYRRFVKTGDPLGVTVKKPHPPRPVTSYTGVHRRLITERGRASAHPCVICANPASQWAYDYTDPNPLENDNGAPFSLDIDRYAAMCPSCHVRHDATYSRERKRATLPNPGEWRTVDEAAKAVGFGRQSIRNWIADPGNDIVASSVRRTVFVYLPSLSAYLKNRRRS